MNDLVHIENETSWNGLLTCDMGGLAKRPTYASSDFAENHPQPIKMTPMWDWVDKFNVKVNVNVGDHLLYMQWIAEHCMQGGQPCIFAVVRIAAMSGLIFGKTLALDPRLRRGGWGSHGGCVIMLRPEDSALYRFG